ncbi:MAG: hypothetical protein KF878_05390 [Planctomycetes bacterium]|nr:hypothetical protein [Planctomycetota bacterium]
MPRPLWPLISLAERFGVSDDLIRADVVARLTGPERRHLREAFAERSAALDDWLSGPEAHGETFTREYIAFTCARMAADEAC